MRGTLLEHGKRDRTVTIQYRRDGVSTTSFPVDDWDTTREKRVPMAREEVRGREDLRGGQVQSSYETRWFMAYRADMDPDLIDVPHTRRLALNGRVLNIIAAKHIGRKEGIELLTIANPSGETT